MFNLTKNGEQVGEKVPVQCVRNSSCGNSADYLTDIPAQKTRLKTISVFALVTKTKTWSKLWSNKDMMREGQKGQFWCLSRPGSWRAQKASFVDT